MGDPTIDGRADVYALGCIAYFLLTGTLVFDDPNPMSLALKHVQAQPEPPSSRTELAIPSDLERIVMHCLGKRPDDRPASAGALADALAELLHARTGRRADADAWWQRHLPPTSSLRSFAQLVAAHPRDASQDSEWACREHRIGDTPRDACRGPDDCASGRRQGRPRRHVSRRVAGVAPSRSWSWRRRCIVIAAVPVYSWLLERFGPGSWSSRRISHQCGRSRHRMAFLRQRSRHRRRRLPAHRGSERSAAVRVLVRAERTVRSRALPRPVMGGSRRRGRSEALPADWRLRRSPARCRPQMRSSCWRPCTPCAAVGVALLGSRARETSSATSSSSSRGRLFESGLLTKRAPPPHPRAHRDAGHGRGRRSRTIC